MENLVIESAFWRGRRVFLTGHTGFKGSWCSLMLSRLGAETTGYALAPPTQPALFDLASVGDLIEDLRGDIDDLAALKSAMRASEPEIIIHMAAQPLVKAGYADPISTYRTNVMGVVNLLEAVRATPSAKVVLNITTDKCYDNRDWARGYRESDQLGGRDPYSNSKACAELVTAAYRASFFPGVAIASARAGNVVGGGDFAADRIVPDAVRAFVAQRALEVRFPKAVRPWQHVLEPLSGYLMLAEQAFRHGGAFADAWNFGPDGQSEQGVRGAVAAFHCGLGLRRALGAGSQRPSARGQSAAVGFDEIAGKARVAPVLSFDEMVEWTADWYRAHARGADMRTLTLTQVDSYLGQCVRLISPFPTSADSPAFEDQQDAAKRIA